MCWCCVLVALTIDAHARRFPGGGGGFDSHRATGVYVVQHLPVHVPSHDKLGGLRQEGHPAAHSGVKMGAIDGGGLLNAD